MSPVTQEPGRVIAVAERVIVAAKGPPPPQRGHVNEGTLLDLSGHLTVLWLNPQLLYLDRMTNFHTIN